MVRRIPLTLAIALLAIPPVAAEQPAQTSTDGWHYAAGLGGHFFGISGPVGIRDFTADVDLDAGDVNDKLDSGIGLTFEFGKGKWTGLVNVASLEFGGDPRGGSLPGGQSATLAPKLDWSTVELGAAYRAVMSEPGPKVFVVEPLFGVRTTDMEFTVDAVTGMGSSSRSVSTDWQEVFGGVRLAKSLTQRVGLYFGADYGFAASGNDEDSWNARAGAAFRFPFDGWSMVLSAGYRIADVKYSNPDDNTLFIDNELTGPTVGLLFHF